MRTTWQSLIWKEWHEHKWKLAALSAILCGVNMLLLREKSRETLGACFWMMNLVAIPLAMFVAVGVAAGERSRGTADFLAALPVPTWRVALVKLAAGLSILCVAIAAAAMLMYLWATTWRTSEPGLEALMETAWQIYPTQFRGGNWFVASALTAMAATGSAYLWTAAAGLHRADEVSAGAKAALVMMGWWGILLLMAVQLDQHWFEGSARKLIASVVLASPGGALIRFDSGSMMAWAEFSWAVWFGFAVHLGIAGWFVFNFGRLPGAWTEWTNRLDVEELLGWLAPPQHSPIAVIAWKQVRESAPVVLAGVGAAVSLAAVLFVANWSSWSTDARPNSLMGLFAEVCGWLIAMFSIFITLVVGVGAGLVDLSPPLNNFWRSRPIDPNAWFWVKFATGLLVLFVALFGPVLALAVVARHFGSDNLWSILGTLDAWSFVGINLSLYVASMGMTCLLRQPIYGAILGIAALFVGPLLVGISFEIFSGIGGRVWNTLSQTQVNTIMASSIAGIGAATLVVGWLAVRNDWGWKR